MANEMERQRWNDEQMVANWPKRERFTDLVTPHVIVAVRPRPGDGVLDVGSGGGKLSIAIAREVQPRGKVTGADISQGMVRLATGRAADAGAKNVAFRVADLQTDEVPGGPFDAIVSQFGVMFFDEPLTAFTNLRKHLKRGGRLAFACWQTAAKNTWFPGPVLAPFVPPPPPPAPGKVPTGPFQFGDSRQARKLLAAAGFVDIDRVPKRLSLAAPADTIADESQLGAVPAERKDEARAAMNRHFDQFRREDGLCRFELNFQLFTARSP
jgi:SAM-dependent methyltransferase